MIHAGHAMPVSTSHRGSEAARLSSRWSIGSAMMGCFLWVVGPLVPLGAPPTFASIEHVFLFMPLVAAPLAFLLLQAQLQSESRTSHVPHLLAQRAQPFAAAMVLASFFLPSGRLAGALAVGWSAVAVMVAVGGTPRAVRLRGGHRANVSLLAAHIFLPIGAAWLLLSRLVIAPRELGAMTVLLAALHFHFSGFTLQILIAAAGFKMPHRATWLHALHRALAVCAAAGIPMIAAGNIGHSPILKFMGVTAMVVSTVALAVTSTSVALTASDRAARLMLLLSAASIALGMFLAGVYGFGELTGRGWIGVPRMVEIHGALNAIGFTLFGLLGHLRLELSGGASARAVLRAMDKR